MKKIAKLLIFISLIFSILACSLSSANTNQPTEIALTDEKPVVVLDSGNPDFPRIALFKGGEVIVPDVDVNQNGEITEIRGATFIAPDGKSIYFYFENGLPVRAIVEDHLIQFENFTGETVDITFISPDGIITKKEKVPFDTNQIPPVGLQSNIHLASMAKAPNNKDINWLPFTLKAVTAFSCVAAATAVIVPTGGIATVLLGASCGILIYETYLAIANEEPPVSVENTGTVISGASCIRGIAQKDPIAAADCASTIIDTVQVATKKSQETEQKLVTMVGASPNTRSELEIVATVEPAPVSTSASECTGLNLTPEECANYGSHEYKLVSCTSEQSGSCLSNTNICDYIEQTTRGYFSFSGMDWTNIGLNSYSTQKTETNNNVPYGYGTYDEVINSSNNTIFTAEGYQRIMEIRQTRKGADNWDCTRKTIMEYVIVK